MQYFSYFQHPYEIYFKGKNHYHIDLGIIFTALMIIMMSFLILVQSDDLINRKNPKVNQNTIRGESNETLNLMQNNTYFAFDLLNIPKETMSDSSLIEIELSQYILTRTLNKDGKEIIFTDRKYLEWEFCGEDKSRKLEYLKRFNNLNDDLTKNQFDKWVCVKDHNLTIGCEFASNFYSEIRFRIKKCSNLTYFEKTNSNCKSHQELISKIGVPYVEFYYTDYQLDTKDYSNPYKPFLRNYFNTADFNLRTKINLLFNKNELISDTGFIYQSLSFSSVIKLTNIAQFTSTDTNVSIFDYSIVYAHDKIITSRYYMKAQEVVAYVGGILKIYITLCSIILYPFVNLKFDYLRLNTFLGEKNKQLLLKKLENANLKDSYDLYNKNNDLKLELKNKASIWSNKDNNNSISENNYIKNSSKKILDNINNTIVEDNNNKNLKEVKSKYDTPLNREYLNYNSFRIIKNFLLSFCYRKYSSKNKIFSEYCNAINSKMDIVEIISKINIFDRFTSHILNRDEISLISYDSENILRNFLNQDDKDIATTNSTNMKETVQRILSDKEEFLNKKIINNKLVCCFSNYYCEESCSMK